MTIIGILCFLFPANTQDKILTRSICLCQQQQPCFGSLGPQKTSRSDFSHNMPTHSQKTHNKAMLLREHLNTPTAIQKQRYIPRSASAPRNKRDLYLAHKRYPATLEGRGQLTYGESIFFASAHL